MSQAIKELTQRKNKVNCIYALIDEICTTHHLSAEDKIQLTFALYL